jgi:alanine racemase
MTATDARLTIDLEALAHNYRVLAREAAGAEVAPVVKADGYGLGAAAIAGLLMGEGARTFFVARVSEGVALRRALGPEPRIYVLDGCPAGAAAALRDSKLTPVLNSLTQLESWAAFGRAYGAADAALHIDTGMNRLGLRVEEAAALAQASGRQEGLRLVHVMSHLACAAEPGHPMNPRQAEAFGGVRQWFPQASASLSSSGGVFLGPDYRFDLVRPGISLYGGGPFGTPHAHLRPVATLHAPILQVRAVLPGETIGYGATFKVDQALTVATVAAGYADGLVRSLAPEGFAWFDGARRRLLGRLSMDLIVIDVTGSQAAAPGAMVELLGPNVPLDETATAAGTAAYEFLVRISGRAERVYRDREGSESSRPSSASS